MDARRITSEMDAVSERLSLLRQEVISLEQWRAELHTALKVVERLGSGGTTQADGNGFQALATDTRTTSGASVASHGTPTLTVGDPLSRPKRQTVPARGLAAKAGQAVIEMLREEGAFLRPMEVVRRLRDQHGITIGLGRPGRETSDLSAAIGHGKVLELTVSRQNGWSLTEWNGNPPGKRELTFTPSHGEGLVSRPSGHEISGTQPSLPDNTFEHDPEPHLADGGAVGK